MEYSVGELTCLRMMMAALAGRNAFSKRSAQRSSQMRQPLHRDESALIGGPVLRGNVVSGVSSLTEMLQFRGCSVKSLRKAWSNGEALRPLDKGWWGT